MRTEQVIARLRALVGGNDERVVHECRLCGATLEAAREECPDCGEAEIAHLSF